MTGPSLELGSCLLLAQDEILRGIRGGLNKGADGEQWLVFLLGAVALGGLLLLAKRYASREEVPKREPRPDYLAAALGVLELTAQEREDAKRLATRARLPQPAAMLLSPANLAYAVERCCANEQHAELRKRLEGLSAKLFGQPLAEGPAAVGPQPEQPSPPPSPSHPPTRGRRHDRGRP